jgi:hypothetical protein
MSISSGSGVAVPEAAGVNWDGAGAGLTAMQLAVKVHGREEKGTGGAKYLYRSCKSTSHGDNKPGTSFSSSSRDLGGPPCRAVIFCRRLAPLFAASRSRLRRALVWVGVSPGSAPVGEAALGESAIVQEWCGRGRVVVVIERL